MPVLNKDNLLIDFSDTGEGEPVILIHSSGSSNRQWRKLIEILKDRYRLLAINLFGYGKTTPWRSDSMQTLADQASLVVALCEAVGDPIHLVGHSMGGAVALKAAYMLKDEVVGLVLLEPNLFYLLAEHGRWEAYEKVRTLSDHMKEHGGSGNWERTAERFVDYWSGDGTWKEMPLKRRNALLEALPNTVHEFDAVLNETTPIDDWKMTRAKTLVVSAAETKQPTREIIELLSSNCTNWSFKEVPSGGHMAPLTHPDLINPIIAIFLDRLRNTSSSAKKL